VNLKIALIGDIAFNGIISTDSEKNPQRFLEVSSLFKRQIFVFANLEFPIKSGNSLNPNRNIIHYTNKEATYFLLQYLNICCVSLANNHIYDYEMEGLKTTIQTLDELGILHTGAGWKKEHIEPVIIDIDGRKIGFIAFVDISTNPNTEKYSGLYINYLGVSQVIASIKKIRNKCDCIICSIHWGKDYSNFYTRNQQIIARQIIDSGVDIIMGHHSHTIQPIEFYKNGVIFYSLGQLCFGDFNWEGQLRALKLKTKIGMMAQFPDVYSKIPILIPTYELKGNYIIIPNRNLDRKLKVLGGINKLKNRFKIIEFAVLIKEAFFDRIIEFFFGYYRNPIRQLLHFKNYKKIKYIYRDFKLNK
jgi:poly-gamma-glutamate synthesis protein (capsule biosynthesis protein)